MIILIIDCYGFNWARTVVSYTTPNGMGGGGSRQKVRDGRLQRMEESIFSALETGTI